MKGEYTIGAGGRKIRPDPSKSIGKGGEADIFNIGNDQVLKIYKPPEHPDFAGMPAEQDMARRRIDEHQRKLPAFPKGLPSRIVAPEELAYDQAGRVAGYIMPFKKGAEVILRYGEPGFRQNGVDDNDVTEVFIDLHATLRGAHDRGLVIGDFNDLNVLVEKARSGMQGFVIDADSAQFGPFLCRVFTERFVDPLLCDPGKDKLLLSRPHNEMSDWYAFAVMLMQTQLWLAGGPYGGVYKPKDPKERIAHHARPLHRITVFNTDVRYPKPSRHFSLLPDGLLQYFHEIFEQDKRMQIPERLLKEIVWKACSKCGTVHSRGTCPLCHIPHPQAVTSVSTATVSAERMFRTEGHILCSTVQHGKLLWLYHHNGEYFREDGRVVTRGMLNPHARYRIRGAETVIAVGNQAQVFASNGTSHTITVDSFGLLPAIDANEQSAFWLSNGQIRRTSSLGAGYEEFIGDALREQTMFWVGSQYGFGFYRAGNLSQCFIFNTDRRGMNDTLTLKPFSGQVVDTACVFGKKHLWFFVSSRTRGKTRNACYMIRYDGMVEAQAETDADDGSWLGTIRGKCAAGDFLLCATDDGVVRVKANGLDLAVDKEFPDSARFVQANRSLFVDQTGLLVVGSREIWRLAVK